MCHNPDLEVRMSASTPNFADRFTGCLLGMAIGDALGTPHAYQQPGRIGELDYRPRSVAGEPTEVPSGQYSINTELALCLLETLVTSDGFVDPEMAAFRFANAVEQPDIYLPNADEVQAIERAVDEEAFQEGFAREQPRYGGPATRAIPIALAHSLSDLNVALITREVLRSVLITHCDPVTVNGALAVAHAVRLVVRGEIPLELVIDEVLSLIDEDAVARCLRGRESVAVPDDVAGVVCAGMQAFAGSGGDFERSIAAAIEAGGATHLAASLAGALAGAHVGAARIPPRLVDGLDGRAYILMASPALLRTAQLRAGLFFHLHLR